ncbi:hypothetical protein HPB49_006394 [Dermacentor silvarum]|uniref:Uncharacterized protein n=1 Tax=Dermacentor silvarum TaxID=543639 RepID=A0ACB8CQ76_DERSI|nr:hypothetical protein HPB49_006394 [Dermacentor silvarum]
MDSKQPASTSPLFTASTMTFASSPPPFLIPGTPAVPWLTWKRSFHTFLQAAGGETLPEERKKAVLLSNLGFESQRLCYDLTSQVDPDTLQFQDIIRLLNKHYEYSSNSLVHRIIFRVQRQQSGESVQEFVTSLHRLAQPACSALGTTSRSATKFSKESRLQKYVRDFFTRDHC